MEEPSNILKTAASIGLASGSVFVASQLKDKLLERVERDWYRETMFSSMILNGKQAREMFCASGLAEKGVKLKNIDRATLLEVKQKLSLKNFFSYGKKLNDIAFKNNIIAGLNACYTEKNKTILCNTKLLGMIVPHEMGHAMNHNSKGFSKWLMKAKALKVLAPVALAVGVLKAKKSEGEKSDTILDKEIDFIKDNCVEIAAISQAPLLLEEGLASIKGAKLAKKVLSPDRVKAINIANWKGWLTYFISSAFLVGTTYVASKLRDVTA